MIPIRARMDPRRTIGTIRTYPLEKTIAFGGVELGKVYPMLAASEIVTNRAMGLSFSVGATTRAMEPKALTIATPEVTWLSTTVARMIPEMTRKGEIGRAH